MTFDLQEVGVPIIAIHIFSLFSSNKSVKRAKFEKISLTQLNHIISNILFYVPAATGTQTEEHMCFTCVGTND